MVRKKQIAKDDPWTDDELDYLDRIGKNMINIKGSDLALVKEDDELTEWQEEIDILDLETVEYLED